MTKQSSCTVPICSSKKITHVESTRAVWEPQKPRQEKVWSIIRTRRERSEQGPVFWGFCRLCKGPTRQHLLHIRFPWMPGKRGKQDVSLRSSPKCWHLRMSARMRSVWRAIFRRHSRLYLLLHRGEYWLSGVWSTSTPNKKCFLSSSLWSTIQK